MEELLTLATNVSQGIMGGKITFGLVFLVITFLALSSVLCRSAWARIIMALLYSIVAMYSLSVSVIILGGCGASGGCEMAGLIFYISAPIFVLSTIFGILSYELDKRWTRISLAILLLLLSFLLVPFIITSFNKPSVPEELRVESLLPFPTIVYTGSLYILLVTVAVTGLITRNRFNCSDRGRNENKN